MTFDPGWFDLTYSQHFRVTDGHVRHEGTDREYVVTDVWVRVRATQAEPVSRHFEVSFFDEDGPREVVASSALSRTTRAWVQPAVDVARVGVTAMVAARKAAVR